MAYTDPMTWRASSRNWSKKLTADQAALAGKKYINVSCRQLVAAGLLDRNAPQTKESSRSAMRQWWEAKQRELEPQAREPVAVDGSPGIKLAHVGIEYDDQGEAWETIVLDHAPLADPGNEAGINQRVDQLVGQAEQWWGGMKPAPTEKQVGDCSTVWLKTLQRRIKASSWDVHRCHIERFAAWMGAASIDAIDGRKLEAWNEQLRDWIDAGEITSTYAAAVWATTTRFLRWAYQTERLEALPRNIDDNSLTITKQATELRTLKVSEVRQLLDAADDRRKLYLLLMLNCGFTQLDVAHLRHDSIDWKKKTISRKREKTASHKAVPYVTYPLWAETYRLLKAHKSNHAEYVLTNSKGEPLHKQEINEQGKLSRTCNVTSALKRLIKAEKIKCAPKHLRKTAASKLDDHDTYGRYAQYFLGHAPRTVAERHYVKPSQTQFDLAIKWLGQQFGQ